ncbi:urease subunit beta [Ureaplasma zalophigenitalium]|uniref:Urease subunit beta n=1 Tax=Ureaplasma zalophigenitalium TaxID=907723 RepID=A0ABT3BPL2_9BACT|nr:urease subunit beta [Ureaplasma zalophigenitalium]MCV3754202.1 urease subunit beta [Ureaplasma zalophigenitalium]
MSGGSNQYTPGKLVPGAVKFAEGDIIVNEGRQAYKIIVQNTGDRPIQVGSHFHLYETNTALIFYDENGNEDKERKSVYGRRFDISSGTAIRFEPGEKKEASIVDFQGTREVYGVNGLINGKLDK